MTDRVILFGDGGDPNDPFRRPPEPSEARPAPAADAPSPAERGESASAGDAGDAGDALDVEFDDLDLDALLADDVMSDDGSAHDDFLLGDDDLGDAEFGDADLSDADEPWVPELPEVSPAQPEPKTRRHLVIDDFDGMDEPATVRSTANGVPLAGGAAMPSAPPVVGGGGAAKVLIDGTDDLPDAISLSDTRREGGNLLIGEDDDISALVLPDERPKMNPKVRERRISVRRSVGRKRLKWIIGIGIPLALIVGALGALASPLFSVEEITVDGAVYTAVEQVEAIVGPLRGEPVLTIDTQQVERQLATLPWVRRVTVDAKFPKSLHVVIVERVPAATYLGTDQLWRIIDTDAGVIDVIPGGAQPADFLPIFGPGPEVSPGQSAGPAYQTLAQLAATLDALPTLRPLITSISVVGPDINLALTTEATVNLGTASELRQKLAVLLTLLSDPERDVDKIVSINVSDPTKPAIE